LSLEFSLRGVASVTEYRSNLFATINWAYSTFIAGFPGTKHLCRIPTFHLAVDDNIGFRA